MIFGGKGKQDLRCYEIEKLKLVKDNGISFYLLTSLLFTIVCKI